MKKLFTLLALASLFVGSINIAFGACGYRAPEIKTREKSSVTIPEETTEKQYKKLATISKKEAKKIATKEYPGKVKEVELINEENTLIWKLEVKGTEGQKELFVDPADGKFLGYGLTK